MDLFSGSDRRAKINHLISAPTNFSHVSHLGPDLQKQRLLDLPTTVDTAEQQQLQLQQQQQQMASQGSATNQRIASMRSIPPRTPPRPTNFNSSKRPQVPPRYPPSSSSSLPRSPSPLDSSVSSLHDIQRVSSSDRKSESRQSITSNNSSSPPPSPIADRLSSSYDS